MTLETPDVQSTTYEIHILNTTLNELIDIDPPLSLGLPELLVDVPVDHGCGLCSGPRPQSLFGPCVVCVFTQQHRTIRIQLMDTLISVSTYRKPRGLHIAKLSLDNLV